MIRFRCRSHDAYWHECTSAWALWASAVGGRVLHHLTSDLYVPLCSAQLAPQSVPPTHYTSTDNFHCGPRAHHFLVSEDDARSCPTSNRMSSYGIRALSYSARGPFSLSVYATARPATIANDGALRFSTALSDRFSTARRYLWLALDEEDNAHVGGSC